MGSGLFELPATSLSEYARCPKRFRFRFLEGHPGLGDGDANARRVGTLAHVALEREIQDSKELARFDPTLATGEVEEALALARRFSASPAFAPVRGCDGPREQPVLLRLGRLTIHGVVDLMGPGFVLDYKTDREVVPQHHHLQLWVYAQATGREAAHLAYLRHDTLHTLHTQELRAAGDEARAVAARISAGSYPARPSLRTCAGCPYAELCDDRCEPATRPDGAHGAALIPVGTLMPR
jgi:ATP-dependent helicase/nuclease subunit A